MLINNVILLQPNLILCHYSHTDKLAIEAVQYWPDGVLDHVESEFHTWQVLIHSQKEKRDWCKRFSL